MAVDSVGEIEKSRRRDLESQRRTETAPPPSPLPSFTPSRKEPAEETSEEAAQPDTRQSEEMISRQLQAERLQNMRQRQTAEAKGETEETNTEGEETEGRADEGGMGMLFGLSLILALTKDIFDIFDIASLGSIGVIINVMVTGAFGIVLLLQGSSLKKIKSVRRFLIAAAAEFIPIVSLLPWWTISVIWEKFEKRKKDSEKNEGEKPTESKPTIKS